MAKLNGKDVMLVGLKGEKGDTGPQGPQGPQGPKGDAGDGGATIKLITDIDQLQILVPYFESESALPTTSSGFREAFGIDPTIDGLYRYVFVALGGSDRGLYAMEVSFDGLASIDWDIDGKKKLEEEMIVRIEYGEVAATGKPGGETFYVVNTKATRPVETQAAVSKLASSTDLGNLTTDFYREFLPVETKVNELESRPFLFLDDEGYISVNYGNKADITID